VGDELLRTGQRTNGRTERQIWRRFRDFLRSLECFGILSASSSSSGPDVIFQPEPNNIYHSSSCLISGRIFEDGTSRVVQRRGLITINISFVTLMKKEHLINNQLDATYYFIVLLIGSTCFGQYYVHHQEIATVMLITTFF